MSVFLCYAERSAEGFLQAHSPEPDVVPEQAAACPAW